MAVCLCSVPAGHDAAEGVQAHDQLASAHSKQASVPRNGGWPWMYWPRAPPPHSATMPVFPVVSVSQLLVLPHNALRHTAMSSLDVGAV